MESSILRVGTFHLDSYCVNTVLGHFLQVSHSSFSTKHRLHVWYEPPRRIACACAWLPRGIRAMSPSPRAPCLGGWRWGGNHDFGIIFDICVKRVNNHFSLITWQHGEDRQAQSLHSEIILMSLMMHMTCDWTSTGQIIWNLKLLRKLLFCFIYGSQLQARPEGDLQPIDI